MRILFEEISMQKKRHFSTWFLVWFSEESEKIDKLLVKVEPDIKTNANYYNQHDETTCS